MISYFPAAYPDELLYSLLARYHLHTCSTSPKQTLDDLYGDRNVRATMDLPGHLSALCRRLPAERGFTPEGLTGGFTLLPYYAAFEPPVVVSQTLAAMIEGHADGIHLRLGMTASTVTAPDRLRFSHRACSDTDRPIPAGRFVMVGGHRPQAPARFPSPASCAVRPVPRPCPAGRSNPPTVAPTRGSDFRLRGPAAPAGGARSELARNGLCPARRPRHRPPTCTKARPRHSLEAPHSQTPDHPQRSRPYDPSTVAPLAAERAGYLPDRADPQIARRAYLAVST